MTDVTLNHVIVHHLVKEQHKPIQPNVLRESVLDSGSAVVLRLVLGVLKAYGAGKNRAHYGVFSSNESKKFPGKFYSYAKSHNIDQGHFMDLSKDAMQRLHTKAESEHLASGGYILFADYFHLDTRFFLIAMIKETAGIAITNLLEPEALIRLDFDRLHQAARINFSKYSEYNNAKDDDEKAKINYLSFLSAGRNVAASGYFVTALGCSRGTTSDRATKTLIDESVNFFRKNPDLAINKEKYKKSLIEYLSNMEASQESVRLSDVGQIVASHIPLVLSEKSDELVDELLTYLNSEKCAVPVEFPPSKKEIRKRTHIKVNAEQWNIEFDRIALGDMDSAPVYYNKASGSLTLKNIPQKTREVLEQELHERNKEDK